MKCPTCETEGQLSRVDLSRGRTTLFSPETYYDEDGDYHNHDTNSTTYQWRCSRGHRGRATTRQACQSHHKGCGLAGGLEIAVDKPVEA